MSEDPKKEARAKKVAWIKQMLASSDESASNLARKAGFSETTLTRFISNPETASVPKDTTLNKIAAASNLPRFSKEDDGSAPDRAEIIPGDEQESSPELTEFINISNDLTCYRQQGNMLDRAGILDGDLLFVDHNATPRNGDVVFVALRDEAANEATSVFRLFHNTGHISVVLTASNANLDVSSLFQIVDGVNAVIYGVVKYTLRQAERS